MTNPTTIDRRDVAHSTNPIGGKTQIEQDDLGRPIDADAGQPAAENLAYTDVQRPNLPAGSEPEVRTSFEQPVEGAENKLRIDPQTKRMKLIEPGR